MAEEGKSGGGGTRVCVTGGAGFVGSWLVKKLLEAGYTVHATLRSIEEDWVLVAGCRGRGESGPAAAAPPRRRAARPAAAVSGRPLRRRQLRAGHRRMPVRLPRRHAVGARGRRV
ncbi:hypothetical protein ACQ4PT_063861 [Festuca glaucescens]